MKNSLKPYTEITGPYVHSLALKVVNEYVLLFLILFYFSRPTAFGQSELVAHTDSLLSVAEELFDSGEKQAAFEVLFTGLESFEYSSQGEEYIKMLSGLTKHLSLSDTYARLYPFDKKIPFFNKIIAIAENQGLDSLMAVKHYQRGVVYYYHTDYDLAKTDFERSKELAKEGNLEKVLLESYYQLARSERNMGNLDKSLESILSYEKEANLLQNEEHMQTAAETLGNFYLNLKEFDKGAVHYKNGIELAKKFNLDGYYSVTSLAMCYEEMDSIVEAHKTYEKAYIELEKETKGDLYNYKLSGLSMNFAEFYKEKLKNYDSALYLFEQGLRAAKEIKYQYYIAYAIEGMAQTYQGMNEYEIALRQRLDNYKLATEIGDQELMKEVEEGLSKNYELLGDYDKALHHYKRGRAIADSLLNLGKVEAITEMETRYESKKKQQEIELLTAKSEQQRVRQLAFIVATILLVLILMMVFIALRNKQRSNRVITAQKQDLVKVNKEMNELSQFKEGLTHMIAHDMKNSLNTILGYSASEPYDKKMKSISQSGQVLLNLVINMLDVQRFEETEVLLDVESCSVKDTVEEARTQVALLFQMKSLRLEIAIQNQQDILVDREIIVRVLVNLLNNAVKYSKPGSLIKLSVVTVFESNKSFCQYSVSDEGVGIEKEKLPYVFDKFWKDSAGAYGPMVSTGLGLTFCKLAVEAHKGMITVDSEIGKGTTFYVNLPVDTSQTAITKENSRTYTVGQDKALILESEREVLEALASKLKQLEVYQVGEINALLKELEDEHLKSRWKKSLENAIYHGNEKAFKDLIEQLN